MMSIHKCHIHRNLLYAVLRHCAKLIAVRLAACPGLTAVNTVSPITSFASFHIHV